MIVNPTFGFYRIVGDEEVVKEIYEKCQQIEQSEIGDYASLALLLDALRIPYTEMPSSSLYGVREYSPGELVIEAAENSIGPSDFGPILCRKYEGLTVDYWLEVEEDGFYASDSERLVRLVVENKIVSNDEALDYVNRELQKSDTFKDLHFDTIEELRERYEEICDEVELQIAEYKSYEDWCNNPPLW